MSYTATIMTRAFVLAFSVLFLFVFSGCEGTMSQSSSRSSETSQIEEIEIKHAMDEVEISQEFAQEMRDKSNQLVVDELGLVGDNIQVIGKSYCTLITLGDAGLTFYTAIYQGSDTYTSEVTWSLENGEWIAMSLKINDQFLFNN